MTMSMTRYPLIFHSGSLVCSLSSSFPGCCWKNIYANDGCQLREIFNPFATNGRGEASRESGVERNTDTRVESLHRQALLMLIQFAPATRCAKRDAGIAITKGREARDSDNVDSTLDTHRDFQAKLFLASGRIDSTEMNETFEILFQQ